MLCPICYGNPEEIGPSTICIVSTCSLYGVSIPTPAWEALPRWEDAPPRTGTLVIEDAANPVAEWKTTRTVGQILSTGPRSDVERQALSNYVAAREAMNDEVAQMAESFLGRTSSRRRTPR